MAILKKLLAASMPWGLANALEADIGNALVATGTSQSDALPIAYGVARFGTVASGTGGILPANSVGDSVLVINAGANALSIYPPSGHSINSLAADAAYSIPVGGMVAIKRVTNTLWLGVTGDSAAQMFLQSGSGASATTVQAELRRWVWVEQFGAVGNGSTNDTAAIQAAIDTGAAQVLFMAGKTYRASGLTQSTNSQSFVCPNGIAKITKNANGVLFTSTGDNVTCINIGFRGDASSPTYTGDNVNASGENFSLINCGSRWTSGRAVKATGGHTQIMGTCDIYQTTDSTSSGYDIELGVSGTATLYHELISIYSSQASGGILMTDTGGTAIVGGQFGKLTIQAGTSPAGVNGGTCANARILGNVSIGIPNSSFTSNAFGAVTITFEAGTSGHTFDESNLLDASATLTNNANTSIVVDRRQVPLTSYTPAWTAASSNPAIGDGSITGYYSKRGNIVTVSVTIVMGSTTTYGSGVWFVSLPFTPTTNLSFHGSARFLDSGTNNRIAVVRTVGDGTARVQLISDAGATAVTSAIPFAWASGDQCEFTITYST